MLKKLWREVSRSRPADPQARASRDELADVRAELAQGDAASARRLVWALPKAHPALPAAACALGDFHHARDEHDRAQECYFRALRSDPLCHDARIGLGLDYYACGDLEEASVQVRTALLLKPGDPECLIQDGVIHLRWGNLEYAAQRLEEGLAVAPDNPHGWNNLGVLRQRCGDLRAALSCFQRAVAIRPSYATAHGNLGLALREFERLDEARAHLERAVALRPDGADGYLNLGTLLQDLGDLAGAVRAYERALELQPHHPEALLGLGVVEQRRGELEHARALVTDALSASPGYAAARTALGEIQLSRGEFAAGWTNYESRLDTPQAPRLALAVPEWRGDRLPGGTLLVYWEQGLGDVILFASCLSEVLAKVGRLLLNVPDPLAPLFARSFPGAEIVTGARDSAGEWLRGRGEIHACAPIGSLMRLFRTDRSSFPRRAGYLSADPARVDAWRERLAALGPGRKLGISWRGGLFRTGRAQRSLPLSAFGALLRVPETTWVSVQYGDCSADLAALAQAGGPRLCHWPEAIKEFEELAGLLSALDGVVTVCNTTAHLAGALGLPGFVLAPRGASWRYQTGEAALPWYPSLRVLRQREEGEWTAVIAEAERAIRSGEPGGIAP
jgi:tetratricopeptide (TPR) repeat protein